MNFLFFILPAVLVLFMITPLFSIIKGTYSKNSMKRRVIFNLCSFGAVCAAAILFPLGGFVSAATEATTAVASADSSMAFLAAALSTGMSAIGAGIAVAAAAPAAIGAFSEDPKAFGKALIFVALGEGVALYGLLISILILNKI